MTVLSVRMGRGERGGVLSQGEVVGSHGSCSYKTKTNVYILENTSRFILSSFFVFKVPPFSVVCATGPGYPRFLL